MRVSSGEPFEWTDFDDEPTNAVVGAISGGYMNAFIEAYYGATLSVEGTVYDPELPPSQPVTAAVQIEYGDADTTFLITFATNVTAPNDGAFAFQWQIPLGASPPDILQQPTNQICYLSNQVTFTAEANIGWTLGVGDDNFYTWAIEQSTNNGETWELCNWSGTGQLALASPVLASATVTATPSLNGSLYRAKFESAGGSATSQPATLIITNFPDLIAVSLNWNANGGVDLAYSLQDGPLTNDTTVGLYWANAPDQANIISPAAIWSEEITPAMIVGSTTTVDVPASELANPPDGASYVLMVLDPSNLVAELTKTNNLLAAQIPPGALQVNLEPPDVVSAGAKWQVDNGQSEDSGAIVSNLPAGPHTISFTPVSGWIAPSNDVVVVQPVLTTTFVGTYTVDSNCAVQVTLSPSGAVKAGAQWQLDFGPDQNSGATVSNLAPGQHIIAFLSAPGWLAPPNQTVELKTGETTKAKGAYTQGKPKLTITSPKSRQNVSNVNFLVTGAVSDKVTIGVVDYQLNGSVWAKTQTTNSWANWYAMVPLRAGSNALSVFASDLAGGSATNTVVFQYIPSATLVVQTNGDGTFSPKANGALLAIGHTYKLTASPAKHWHFSSWVASGSEQFVSNNPVLEFLMESGLVLEANFVTNAVVPAQGAITAVRQTTVYSVPQPGITRISLSGTNLVISGTNGSPGTRYVTLMSTNLSLPLSQWIPITTNTLSTNGDFTITATNAVSPTAAQQFYILDTQ